MKVVTDPVKVEQIKARRSNPKRKENIQPEQMNLMDSQIIQIGD